MKHLWRSAILVLLVALFGCAHAIQITPTVGSINVNGIDRIDKAVGYYISADDLAKVVVTGAGGGDKVKYQPYKESEPALRQALGNVFKEVYAVPSLESAEFIAEKQIAYVFIPVITTYSSSRSMWIWPPSDFTVRLVCKAIDASGKVVWEEKITGDAHMRLPDVARDHSLAGREATAQAFSALQEKILTSGRFR